MSVVDHPEHYTLQPVECINITGYCSFCVGNAIKYVWRHLDKGKPVEDLRKAYKYLQFIKADPRTLRGLTVSDFSDLMNKLDQCTFSANQYCLISRLLQLELSAGDSHSVRISIILDAENIIQEMIQDWEAPSDAV